MTSTQFLQSVIFGLIPESLFFAYFIIVAKQIKTHRTVLCLLFCLLNVGMASVFAFTLWYHFLMIFGMYGVLYLLYRYPVIDVFLLASASIILSLLSAVCLFMVPNYIVGFALNRTFLAGFLLIFQPVIKSSYDTYINNWDITSGAKIKSLTLRNISLISLNIFLTTANVFIVFYQNAFQKGGI